MHPLGLVLLLAGLSRFVNPFIGTEYNGHTYPNAALPFGFVQPGPQTGNFDWDYCGGYRHNDPSIEGFTQNRISGTGVADLGDLLLMPFSRQRDSLASPFSDEQATPGFYGVTLTEDGIRAEMSCTPHVSFFRFRYGGEDRKLYIDTHNSLLSRPRYDHRVISASVRFSGPETILGALHVRGWVTRRLFFAIRFNSAPADTLRRGDEAPRLAPEYWLDFGPGKEDLLVKVALSTVSEEGALANLETELPGWDFKGTRKAARKAWDEALSLLRVRAHRAQKTALYTSLYHLMLQPAGIADCDGRYRGADDLVHEAEGGQFYSILSQWDTFRAANSFYNLFVPEVGTGVAQSAVAQCGQQGYLPIWALWGQETKCMIGNHSVPPVVEAALLGRIDAGKAYEAVRRSLTESHPGSDWESYDRYGYYPFDIMRKESVSKVLECSYDDWCAALLARRLGRSEDEAFFLKRSKYYRALFDPSTRLFRGKDSAGNWRTPFNPYALSHAGTHGGDFTEGNAWQYAWHVLQDPEDLMALMGGPEAFVEKLDSLFTLESSPQGESGFVKDVTGLIGQYAHGNEPSHHVIYLYTLAGRPDRTAEAVREVFDKFYLPRPDGLCGNDDCGQMSAWHLFSALGFYPFDPALGRYVLGAPQVRRATLRLPGGKRLRVVAKGLSDKALYVASAQLNGRTLDRELTRDDLLAGGTLTFKMTHINRIPWKP